MIIPDNIVIGGESTYFMLFYNAMSRDVPMVTRYRDENPQGDGGQDFVEWCAALYGTLDEMLNPNTSSDRSLYMAKCRVVALNEYVLL